uniref:adenosine deaminase-like n=1 Tax=Ciona intestinalis TaxID=7719 RepID=UPI0000524138|nr:adenosine deaminase-like [Ciona intestinalis]|eukprot:XP_002121237.1 adenosine deaminase-like [Ciona intestinalis]
MPFDFPKAELHCHLDGCFRLSTCIELARERGVELPSYDVNELRSLVCKLQRTASLDEYLAHFMVTTPVFAGSREAIKRLTMEAIEDKHQQGISYIEFRFCPHLLADCDVTPRLNAKTAGTLTPRGVVEAVCTAAEEARSRFPVVVRFILCALLDLPDWSMELAHMCKEFALRGVVALDIAGAGIEADSTFDDHKAAFDFCKEHSIDITVHAGEKGGPNQVHEAVHKLHATRIGHGYKTINDKAVYDDVIKKQIHLEVCPISSNLTASVPEDMTAHPAISFLNDGVNFSLNTDNPGFHDADILHDYDVASRMFRFTEEQIKELNLNALRSSFVEAPMKEKLIKDFKEAYCKA